MRKDLINQKFGRLTAIKSLEDHTTPKGYKIPMWLCQCECGNKATVSSYHLLSGHTQSCGCLQKEIMGKVNKKYNTYDLSGEYGIGYTNKGEEFYFDLEDYDKIKGCYWQIDSYGYVRNIVKNNTRFLMHRVIMNTTETNIIIDHINHQCNDNRKKNLRLADKSKNGMNVGLRKNNTSGTTGVTYDKQRNKWCSAIVVKRKTIHLGRFDNIEDAIKARKQAEEKYFREYSYDNSKKLSASNN